MKTEWRDEMKTDDEIQREKNAVQKMVGAKFAMESALERIKRLETTLSSMTVMLDDAAKKVGPDLYIKTYHWPKTSSEAITVSLQDQINRVSKMARDVL